MTTAQGGGWMPLIVPLPFESFLLIVVIWQEAFCHVTLWKLVERWETLNCLYCLYAISFLPFLLCFLCILKPHEEPQNIPYVMSSLGQSWDYKEYLGVGHSAAFQGSFLGASGPSMVMPFILLSMKPNQYFLKWNLLIPQGYYRECKVWPKVLSFLLMHGRLPWMSVTCLCWDFWPKLFFPHCLISLYGTSDQDA